MLQTSLDERFSDRRGCGDELYGDAREKASQWLAGLYGARVLLGSADLDAGDDDDFDDIAAH